MNTTLQKLIVPIAIIVAGALIAGAIYITQSSPKTAPSVANALQQQTNPSANITVAPITDQDHIRGNKNAKIVIVDYSDLECPFCKSFHQTLQQIYDEYSKDNTVAWVFRNFPLDIHPKAPHEAEAAECANELGGNDAFWKYIDTVFQVTTSNNTLDPAQLPIIAQQIGLDKTAFNNCLNSGKYAAKIQSDIAAAKLAGGQGTPYTVLIVNGQTIPLVDSNGNGLGALPYASMKSIIDQFAKS